MSEDAFRKMTGAATRRSVKQVRVSLFPGAPTPQPKVSQGTMFAENIQDTRTQPAFNPVAPIMIDGEIASVPVGEGGFEEPEEVGGFSFADNPVRQAVQETEAKGPVQTADEDPTGAIFNAGRHFLNQVPVIDTKDPPKMVFGKKKKANYTPAELAELGLDK